LYYYGKNGNEKPKIGEGGARVQSSVMDLEQRLAQGLGLRPGFGRGLLGNTGLTKKEIFWISWLEKD
jgi:hypothetical protein